MADKPVWSVPVSVDDVPESGRHFELKPDEATRAALARAIGVRGLPQLHASFDLSRRGRHGLNVAGRVTATVEQDCIVTLEPMEGRVDEEVDIAFVPGADDQYEQVATVGPDSRDPPEPLVGGTVDLGAVAAEFLVLGVDPYPRKPDASFDQPAPADSADHPFAALAALKKGEKQ